MKTLFKNILKYAFVGALLLVGSTTLAAKFDMDPAGSDGQGNGTNFTSISTNCSSNCANQDNEISIGSYISNPGDSKEFKVFLDFRNKEAGTLTNVKGSVSYPAGIETSSTATLTGKLNASQDSVTDTAKLTNLPDKWKIDFVSGKVEVKERESGTLCNPHYGMDFTYSRTFNSPSNASINDLRYQYGNGWCDQGYVTTTLKITNMESSTSGGGPIDPVSSLELETKNATSVTTSSARLNGEVKVGDNITAWFAKPKTSQSAVSCGDGTSQVGLIGDTYSEVVSGLSSDTTYYYRFCGFDNKFSSFGNIVSFKTESISNPSSDAELETGDYTSLSYTTVVLNGKVVTGPVTEAHYLVSKSSSLSCNSSSYIFKKNYANQGTLGNNYPVNDVAVLGLDEGEKYYYVLCAKDEDGNILDGGRRSFETNGGDDNNDNDKDPHATTKSAKDVDEESAELRGEVDMNDFDDGTVFFVWSTDRDDVDDARDEDEYSDIDDAEKEKVDTNHDGDDSFDLDIDDLDTNDKYYFAICVEYYDNGDKLECGTIKSFETDRDGNNFDIETKAPSSYGTTSARLCGDLVDDGGDDQKTWIEYRKSSRSSYADTSKKQRSEGYYCDSVTGLSSNTTYYYRACATDGCGSDRSFRTTSSNVGTYLGVVTEAPTSVRANSAVLNGFYVADTTSSSVWFDYGRSQSLGKTTRSYSKYGPNGTITHNFTNLAANTTYYYRAVVRNSDGDIERGSIYSFRTGSGGTTIVEKPVVEIVEKVETKIDLSTLGLGLSLVRLEIDDDREIVSRGEGVTYEITWENISEIDLTDLDLRIEIPEEVQITQASRGRLDRNKNSIFVQIDELDAGDDGEMTVSGIVGAGEIGDALVADATIAFDNPVNDAQENATDYDSDEYAINTYRADGSASIFGLGNITFLGWLVILLGLLIIFLIARWLYLEREELRAQAYVQGYHPAPYTPQAPAAPVYREQVAPPVVAPQNPSAPADNYQPYRPNRG